MTNENIEKMKKTFEAFNQMDNKWEIFPIAQYSEIAENGIHNPIKI